MRNKRKRTEDRSDTTAQVHNKLRAEGPIDHYFETQFARRKKKRKAGKCEADDCYRGKSVG